MIAPQQADIEANAIAAATNHMDSFYTLFLVYQLR
jgi:hypothetical protein